MKLPRRTLLLGSCAAVVAISIPLAQNGLTGFLRRIVADHFGDDTPDIEGVNDFIEDYASLIARDDKAKRMGANLYFGFRGDQIKEVALARDLENRFLQTILTRSNIIAVHQGRDDGFEYSDADPWAPVCGSYLTAIADTMG